MAWCPPNLELAPVLVLDLELVGGTLLDRPALEQLRRDVRTPLFDAVYFLDTDRIARDVTYQTIILGELLKYGKQIIIKGKDYVNNPENKFTVTVLAEVTVPRVLFADILRRIDRLRSRPPLLPA